MSLSDVAKRTTIDNLSRGIPAGTSPTGLDRIGDFGWLVPAEDVTLPVMTVNEVAFAHNIEVINRYAAEHDVYLCAHGKTMMAPQLLEKVLSGRRTVGLCAATVQQAGVMAACGAKVVLIANQVVGRANIVRLAELIETSPLSRVMLLIDSLASLDQLLQHGVAHLSDRRRLGVLIEVGTPGGRAGVRTLEEANRLLAALVTARSEGAPIELLGVSTYEGAVPTGENWDTRVEQLFSLTASVYRAALPHIRDALPPIISAGGSATFDLVVNSPSLANLPGSPQIWLRPGVAPTYDHVVYQERLAAIDQRSGFILGGHRESAVGSFRPALALWAVVQSTPEPGLAIIAAGIRDFPADAGYPTLLAHYRKSLKLREFRPGDISMSRANDQHGYLTIDDAFDVQIGDVLKFGISHPCTAFDKWPILFCVDDDERITRAIRTYF